MNRRIALAVTAGALVLGLAACGGGDGGNSGASSKATTTTKAASAVTTTTAPASTTTTAASGSATVQTGNASVGTILVNSSGRTLYAFANDQGLTSSCTGGCASAWPPLMATGAVTAGNGVDASKLTTAPSGQVAYNGHLLYLYSADNAAGQTNGQGLGGVWHVVAPSGDPIM